MASLIRRLAKRAIATFIALPVIRRRALARRFRGRGLVLMYHRVLASDEAAGSYSNDAIVVSTENFDRQLRLLRRYFTPVTLEQFTAWLEGAARFDRPPCLITFDDGWLDNYHNAAPILQRHSTPALIFLPVDYIGTGALFWQERLSRLLHRAIQRGVTVPTDIRESLGVDADRLAADYADGGAVKTLVNRLKDRPYEDIEWLLEALESRVGEEGNGPDRYLDWTQAGEMTAMGIEFGSHGCSHRIMTRLDPDTVSRELQASKTRIEEALDRPVGGFAYPNGDYDDAVKERVRQAGYPVAFTIETGIVEPGADPLAIKRISVHEGAAPTNAHFIARLAGAFA